MNAKSKFITIILVSLGIIIWQASFTKDSSSIPEKYTVNNAVGGGGHIFVGFKQYAFFLHKFGYFPLATNISDSNVAIQDVPRILNDLTAQDLSRIFNTNPAQLIMEVHDSYRGGDLAKVLLLRFDLLLGTPFRDISYKNASFTVFLLSLLTLWLSLSLSNNSWLGIFAVILIGSSSFQLFSVYVQNNVFSFIVSCATLLAAINYPIFKRRSTPLPNALFIYLPIMSGLIISAFIQVRSETIILAPVLGCSYLFVIPGIWKRRIILLLVLTATYFSSNLLWRTYFDFHYKRTALFLSSVGGVPYYGERLQNHTLWHSIFCGLGDYGRGKGYQWNDFTAYAFALPKLREKLGQENLWSSFDPNPKNKVLSHYFMDESYDDLGLYRKKLEDIDGYNEVLKKKIISDIVADPVWFLRILTKRSIEFLKNTNGLQIFIGKFRLDVNFSFLGLTILIGLIIAIKKKQNEIAFLIIILTGAGLGAIAIFSGNNARYYNYGHIIATILIIQNAAGYVLSCLHTKVGLNIPFFSLLSNKFRSYIGLN